jgi:hypothetical protein
MASISRRFDAMIASDGLDIEAIASEFDSDAMASISRRFDAMIASDDLDIEATASEFDSDASASVSRRFDAMIASDDLDKPLHQNLILMQRLQYHVGSMQ